MEYGLGGRGERGLEKGGGGGGAYGNYFCIICIVINAGWKACYKLSKVSTVDPNSRNTQRKA